MMRIAAINSCILFISSCLFVLAHAKPDVKSVSKVDESGKKGESIQMQAPAMTEEDQHGYNMPDRYRCDSCKAVVYHLNEKLVRKQPNSRRLKEWEYGEVFEETCKHAFTGYGVQLVNGENALSGAGLPRQDLEPGMGSIQMSGSSWENRLGEICRKIVYDMIGEDSLYERFHSEGKLSQDLCSTETKDCQHAPKGSAIAEGSRKKTAKQTSSAKKEENKKKKKTDSVTTDSKEEKQRDEQLLLDKLQGDVAMEAAIDSVDISTFLARLAAKHGVPVDEYTRKRGCKEWEQLMVKAAGRIFEHSGVSEKSLVQV